MVLSDNVRRSNLERYTSEATAAREPLEPDFMQRYLPTYAAELSFFVQAVETGSAIDSDFESGRRALLLADAARSSHVRRLPVTVNLPARS
jgi:myo-inositol 2-dehydrogenase / D-chiro-inositol 1-dehydrogenase